MRKYYQMNLGNSEKGEIFSCLISDHFLNEGLMPW